MVHKARDDSSDQAYSCYSGVVYIDVSATGLEKIVMLSSSVVHFTDVLSKGVWQTIESTGPRPQTAGDLFTPPPPSNTLLQGKANSTTTKYVRGFMESLGRATN